MDLIDISLYVMYVFIIIPIVLVIVFPIVQMIQNPEVLKKTLMALLSIVSIWLIGYFLSGNETEVYDLKYKIAISPLTSQVVGGSLICLYILFVISALVIVYSTISKIFK